MSIGLLRSQCDHLGRGSVNIPYSHDTHYAYCAERGIFLIRWQYASFLDNFVNKRGAQRPTHLPRIMRPPIICLHPCTQQVASKLSSESCHLDQDARLSVQCTTAIGGIAPRSTEELSIVHRRIEILRPSRWCHHLRNVKEKTNADIFPSISSNGNAQ